MYPYIYICGYINKSTFVYIYVHNRRILLSEYTAFLIRNICFQLFLSPHARQREREGGSVRARRGGSENNKTKGGGSEGAWERARARARVSFRV